MKYFLFTILSGLALFSSAQDVQDENNDDDSKVKYDEYKGIKIDGMAGIQYGIHPANFNTVIYTLGAFPRYNFVAPKDWVSISAGVPVQMGFDLLSGSGGTFISFTSDLPAVVDLNLGSQSTPEDEYYVGGFVGGGINYNLSYFLYNNQKIVSHSFGPVVHAGLRWRYNGRPGGIRVAYLRGLISNFEKDDFLVNDEDLYPSFISLNLTYGIL